MKILMEGIHKPLKYLSHFPSVIHISSETIICFVFLRVVSAYLFSQPADVFKVGVCGGCRRGPQVGVDVCQRLRQESGYVGVYGSEPGAGCGSVFTAQHHGVLAVRGVQLQQPAWNGETFTIL